jgi:hypothetical protein
MRDQWSMSNSLKVSDSTELVEVLQTTIYSLEGRGWSRRRIARELGIDRETVGRYLRLAKPAISTADFAGAGEAKSAISTAGLEEASSELKPAISTVGNGVGRKSQCEPLAAVIMAKVELGLSAQRIYQDLVGENGTPPTTPSRFENRHTRHRFKLFRPLLKSGHPQQTKCRFSVPAESRPSPASIGYLPRLSQQAWHTPLSDSRRGTHLPRRALDSNQ